MARKQLGAAASGGEDAVTKGYSDSSTQTLTNKSISGSSNTLSDIPQSAVTGLEADIAALEAVEPHPALRTEFTDRVITIPRFSIGDIGWNFYSGQLHLTYLYPQVNRTVSNLSIYVRDAGGAATTAQLGLFSVDGSGNLTLLETTTNDTDLLTSAWTTKTKALSGSVSLVAGNSYAIGYLVVTSNSLGSVEGQGGRWDVHKLSPRLCAKLDGQSSIPSSISAGSLLDSGIMLLVAAS